MALWVSTAVLVVACGGGRGSTDAASTATSVTELSRGTTVTDVATSIPMNSSPIHAGTSVPLQSANQDSGTPVSTVPAPVTSTPSSPVIDPGRVLIVGDSVGYSVAASVLASSPNGSALGIRQLTSKAIIACTLARWATKARNVDGKVSDIPACTTWPQLWQPELAQHPDTALLVIGNPGAQELLTPEGQWTRPCDAGYSQRMRADLTDGMSMLKQNAGRVAVTTAGYWRPPPARQLPGVDYRSFDVHTDCLNGLIREVAGQVGVHVIDMGSWICPTRDTCRETEGAVTLRPDGIHYDGPGGPIVMRFLLSQLRD